MKREEILQKLGFTIPREERIRVIVHSDLKNEADDDYAVMHHLLSPTEEVVGIIAGHFEWFPRLAEELKIRGEAGRFGAGLAATLRQRGNTMQMSYEEGERLLSAAEIDDVPLMKGAAYELARGEEPSEGAKFIVQEAMKEDKRPLYVCFLGGITDLAAAYKIEPRIAEKLTVVWIGGGPYPAGCCEFNLCQDIDAANLVFESNIPLWQVPMNVYRSFEVSFAELAERVAPCGRPGRYLFEELVSHAASRRGLPGQRLQETWVLGDNPTVSVLLEKGQAHFNEVTAPHVNEDGTYSEGANKARLIRVYNSLDAGLAFRDLFAKLALCYKP